VCEKCIHDFDGMTSSFDELLRRLQADIDAGRAPKTPTARVTALAAIFESLGTCSDSSYVTMTWWLAVAVERLLALEQAGVPT